MAAAATTAIKWKIVHCSCHCGGRYAWMKSRESGAWEMVGCICHHLPLITLHDTVEGVE